MALETYQSEFTAEDFENAIRAVPNIGGNGNWFIGDTDTGVFAGGVKVEGAEVGQTIVVKAVDENGKPTEWECAELPSSKLPLVAEVVLTEEVSSVTIDTDLNGNPFNIADLVLFVGPVAGTPNTEKSNITCYFNKNNTAVQRFGLTTNILPTTGGWTNGEGKVYRFQKLKYGFMQQGFETLRHLSNSERSNFYTDTFNAVTLFCTTSGFTFGVGMIIRVYGR